MADTPNLAMALLEGAQSQKHVTVNEALTRLDAMVAGRLVVGNSAPPIDPAEGLLHIVPAGAVGAWAGHEGELALFVNGGWEFAHPWPGLTGRTDAGQPVVHDGMGWAPGLQAAGPGGAATLGEVIEIDHVLGAGPVSVTVAMIPDKAVVIGVTARVMAQIGGATAWSLGVAGSPDRYGSGFGTAAGSVAHGVTGSPLAYYGDTPLELPAAGGEFSAGAVRLAVHMLSLRPPHPL